MKIAYITDSGTGLSIDEMAKDKIFSLPLQIEIKDKNYFDLEQISNDDILKHLKANDKLLTSLPNLGLIEELFIKIKKEGFDEVIAVPICSGLSGTINALNMVAKEHCIPFSYIDCYVTAEVQKYLINLLKYLISDLDMPQTLAFEKAQEVVDTCNTILVPNDLMHLTKSGRLTPLAAGIGNFLNIKPILRINKATNGKIDVISKARTYKKALAKVLEIMQDEIEDDNYVIYIAHVDAYDVAFEFKEFVKEKFPLNEINIIPLCNPVAIHTGIGCLAIQYFKKISD